MLIVGGLNGLNPVNQLITNESLVQLMDVPLVWFPFGWFHLSFEKTLHNFLLPMVRPRLESSSSSLSNVLRRVYWSIQQWTEEVIKNLKNLSEPRAMVGNNLQIGNLLVLNLKLVANWWQTGNSKQEAIHKVLER